MLLLQYFFLKVNFLVHIIYLAYLRKLVRDGHHIKAISSIENLALLYSKKYIGLLASNQLENLLKEIGKQCIGNEDASYIIKNKSKPFKILHLATEFYDIGGHTRVVQDWVKDDIYNEYEILLTNQKVKLSLRMQAPLHFLNRVSYIDKAKELRDFVLSRGFDKIVIHQHWHDVVPTLALWDFKAKEYGIETIFYVHSDFKFSLGNSICSKRIDFTEFLKTMSLKYRPIVGESYTLQFPLENSISVNNNEKKSLRKSLNITDNRITFLSVASTYKFKPYKNINFLHEWNSFLKSNKELQLVVIGCNSEDFNKFCPGEAKANNLYLKGYLNEVDKFYESADYAVSPYPISTGLGMYNAIAYKVSPIFSYYGVIVTEIGFKSLFPSEFADLMNYNTKEDYFNFIDNEIENKELVRIADKVLPEFLDSVSVESWRKQLQFIYDDKVNCKNIKGTKDNDRQNLILTQESLNWYNYSCNDKNSIILLDELIQTSLAIDKLTAFKILALGLLIKPRFSCKIILNVIKRKL